MRHGLSVLAAAALVAGAATTVLAQTQSAPTNPNTKVYAYKKAAPYTDTNTSADPSTVSRQQRPFEYMVPDSAAYGSAAWWQEMGRVFGGGDGGQ